MRTLFRDPTCVFPGETVRSNVLVEDGRIVSVDAARSTRADEVIDASGLHMLPGVIDDQVHFREPGFTDREDLHSGSVACARGGVTSFLEMPNTNPPATTVARLHEKLELAASKSVVNYGFYIGATPDNIEELNRAERTPGIKIFIGSSTGELLVDEQAALAAIFAETALPICAHCEDEATVRVNAERFAGEREVAVHSRIRSREAAVIATRRAIELAVRHEHRFHVLHVSTADEIPLIREAGELVTAEVCPHHLLFHVDDYARLGARVQVNPSIKTRDDNEALWEALLDGDIDLIATDHAPHKLSEKNRSYPGSPSGVPAVENSLMLLLDLVNAGHCSLQDVARWMCENPARVWNIPRKGRIEAGFDADLVLVDMNAEHTILDANQVTKCGWSPWHGRRVTGVPVGTWVRGRRVYWHGEFDTEQRGGEIEFDRGETG